MTYDNHPIHPNPHITLKIGVGDTLSDSNWQKGDFLSKIENILSTYDSFIHFTMKFNSKDYSI